VQAHRPAAGTTPRHILMTADAVGGVWQYATDLAAALGAHGHTVTLAVLGPAPTSDQRLAAQRMAGLRLVETGLPLDWLSAGAGPVARAAEAIAELARREGADLIHCNMPTLAGAAAFPVPVVAVTHGCIATWWQAARMEPLLASYRWHKRMMARGLAAADVVVAPSASYAAIVRRTYRLPTAPLVVHNGRAPLPPSLTAEPPLDAALTIGRLWDPVKNAAMLDRIAARLPLPFLAAGAVLGPHGELIRLKHLKALGQLDAAPLGAMLARRPIFVSAASFEPFGLAVLEAAQAGCPLVLSDIPTFRELWDGAALFVPPGDEEGLAAAIGHLAVDEAERAQLGTRAAQRAARYTPAAKAAAMARIYQGLLARQEEAA
jgi:glycosyltransferase involved in cell wall biosynthesis